MKELLVLRHAETEWNLEGRMQGALDSPLTQTGRAQIAAMRDQIAAYDLQGWDWFSSPAGRAVETAQGLMPRSATLKTDERLREIEIGPWQGQLRDRLPIPDRAIQTEDGPLGFYLTAAGIEPMTALRARCSSFLDALTRPSIVVTHGIASRMLRAVALGLEDEALAQLPGGQGRVFHINSSGRDIAT